MANVVDEALAKIGKSTVIILVGTAFGMTFALLSRILIARYFGQTHYGIYSLGITAVSILTSISMLGLNKGLPRQMSKYKKTAEEEIDKIVNNSIYIVTFSSVIFSALLFFLAEPIAINLFREPGLTETFKIFSIAIPFSVLLRTIISIFRGAEITKARVYFRKIMRNIFFISGIGILIILELSFNALLWVYVSSIILAFLLSAIYLRYQLSFKFKSFSLDKSINKELLTFSIPLLGSTVLFVIMNWTDTWMLGIFKSSSLVGLYQSAYPLARVIPLGLTASAFLFLPVLTRFYSADLHDETKRTYQITTKWIFTGAFFIFFLFFVFPKPILRFFFGTRYVDASNVLRILSLGFLGRAFFGLNSVALMSIGKTKTVMKGDIFGVSSNVFLNLILIPSIGIFGAAVASTTSLFIRNIYNSKKLYQMSGIHPFSKKYQKYVGISISILMIMYIFSFLINTTIWSLLPLSSLFFIAYFGSILISKSIETEDIELISRLIKKIGIKNSSVKSFLKKFE